MDTICAISTPAGAGAVAVLRLSGGAAWEIALSLLRAPFAPEAERVYLRKIFDGDAVLDRALVTFFRGPRSFTGEDIVEFAVHGSSYIKGRLMELLAEAGARPARGGEFSYRAFLNGKMDLAQAEGLCDLISADSRAAHAAGMAGLEGKVSAKFGEIKTVLSELLAQIEVRLDDVDGEMAPLGADFVRGELARAKALAARLSDSYGAGKCVKEGIKVSIVGEPNAGKSSVLNALLGFDRAIVSDAAGTTRDTVEDSFIYAGQKIIITDTAGIRAHAQDFAEKEGISRSLKSAGRADVVLFVADGASVPDAQEQALYSDIKSRAARTILVLNKSDLGIKKDFASPAIPVSAATGEGIENLKNAIIKTAADYDGASVLITSAVQYAALLECQKEISAAQSAPEPEFMAEHLRGALRAIKETIGEVTPDDILGIIFSKFCVGK